MSFDRTVATDWLHAQNSWLVGVALVAGMLLAGQIGYLIGWRCHKSADDAGRGHFGGVQAALLGLLALLLGFTLNIADQRFESRRRLMLDDAVALGSLNLRAGFLNAPDSNAFRTLLLQYVDQFAQADHLKHEKGTPGFVDQAVRAEDLHRRMTDIVRAELQAGNPPAGVDAMVAQLGDALAIHRRWITAMETQVPSVIFALLIGTALVSAAVVGFSGGLAQSRTHLQSLLLTVFVSGILFVIHELDTPDTGFAQSEREPFLHLSSVLADEIARKP